MDGFEHRSGVKRMRDFGWRRTRDWERRRALKTVCILFTVTILYAVYHYQGSARFFALYLGGAVDPERLQAVSVFYQWTMGFFLLGCVPLVIIRAGLKERILDYGLGMERPGVVLAVVLIGFAVATPFVYFGARREDIAAIYPLVRGASSSPLLFFKSSLFYFLYYVGYEICFRGMLYIGIRDDVGDAQAVAVSFTATVLLHVTQPQSELILAMLAGIAFPLIVKRLRSLWPVILIHGFTGITLDYWIIVHSGGFTP